MRLTCAVPSRKPPPISCQPRGVPCPGTVETMFHHMYSIPSSSVHSVLQAMVQVWQPRHLFMSNTAASWRLTFGGWATALLPYLQRQPVGRRRLDPGPLLVRALPDGEAHLAGQARSQRDEVLALHGERARDDDLPAPGFVGPGRRER